MVVVVLTCRPVLCSKLARRWCTQLAGVVSRDSPRVPVAKLWLACVKRVGLRVLLAQLLVNAAQLLEKALGMQVRQEQPKALGQIKLVWYDMEDADLVGAGLDRLLCSHIACSRAALRVEKVIGICTDKGNVKTLNLQPSVITTPGNLACVACPQVVVAWWWCVVVAVGGGGAGEAQGGPRGQPVVDN